MYTKKRKYNKLLAWFYLIPFLLVASNVVAKESHLPLNWPWTGVAITATGGSSIADERDIAYLSKLGVNAVMVRLDVRQYAKVHGVEWKKALDDTLSWFFVILAACKKNHVVAILSINNFPFYESKINQNSVEFWSDRKYLNGTLENVRYIVARLKDVGDELIAYEFISEPALGGAIKILPPSWSEFRKSLIATIREIDKNRYIVTTAGLGGAPDAYRGFVPLNEKKIIYGAHMYIPHAFTHQKLGGRVGTFSYPAYLGNEKWDKDRLKKELSPLIEFGRKYHVHVWIGEFSAVRWANGGDIYIQDLIELFKKNDFGWSYFGYKVFHGWDPYFDDVIVTSVNRQSWMKSYVGTSAKRWSILVKSFHEKK